MHRFASQDLPDLGSRLIYSRQYLPRLPSIYDLRGVNKGNNNSLEWLNSKYAKFSEICNNFSTIYCTFANQILSQRHKGIKKEILNI